MNTELLNALADIAYARQAFFRRHSVIPYSLMRQFLTNEANMLSILNRFPAQLPPPTRAAQIDIPVNLLDALFPNLTAAGGIPRTAFWDAVTIALTSDQISTSLLDYTPPADNAELCPICQEGIPTLPAVELATCHHHMHRACATTWFSLSTRCPVCRGDLRSLAENTTNEPE